MAQLSGKPAAKSADSNSLPAGFPKTAADVLATRRKAAARISDERRLT